jgi:hypothetical protein
MAATNFTPISLYYSATASATPTAGNLVAGELAINTNDGKLFYKDSSGVVQTLASKSTGTIGGSTTQVQYNSSGSLAGSANMTFNGTTLTLANDASISGLTVGKGGGSVSTNTALGNSALSSNSTGANNSFVGYFAGTNTTASLNSGFGAVALQVNSTGASNSAFGGYALYLNSSGSYNTALGQAALQNNTTASNNTAVGYQAGYSITTGINNLCIGAGSGNGLVAGQSNIYIGMAGYASSTGSGLNNEMVITTSNSTGKGTNTGFINPNGGGVYQGNNSTLWSVTSDQRLKKNIVDHTEGLDKIVQLRVRNYEYRLPEEVTELEPQNAIDIKGVQLGLIAQELAEVLPDCVKTESTGVMSVDATNITWHMINAIKDLKALNDSLTARIATLENK